MLDTAGARGGYGLFDILVWRQFRDFEQFVFPLNAYGSVQFFLHRNLLLGLEGGGFPLRI
jgi:hypothetical protein